MILPPLVFRILQHLELIRRQQEFDILEGCLPVRLEASPDRLQLLARGLNLCRIFRLARLPARLLGGINPRLVGRLVFLACVGEVFLDGLQFGSLLVGELQLFLETGRKEGSFAQRPVLFQRLLVFPGLGEGLVPLVLVSCASDAGAASTSELLMASRVSLVFMCFLYVGQACLVA